MKKSLSLFFLITAILNLFAQPGSLDTSFGIGGITITQVPGMNHTNFTNGALQSDGKIIAVGWVAAGNNVNFVVARFLPTGFPDPVFGTGGFTITDFGNGDFAYAVVIQQDGKIIVGGRSDAAHAFTAYCLARYNTDGSLDVSFGNGGKVMGQSTNFGDEINSLAIDADDKIIAVGHLIVDNIFKSFVLRFNSDGSPDKSFRENGRLTIPVSGLAGSVVVQTDNRILLSAQVNTTNGEIRYNTTGLIRYFNDGSLDNSFGKNGIVVVDPPAINVTPHEIVLQADNRIVVAGWSDFSIYIARFFQDGTPDSSFGIDGVVITPFENGNIFAYSIIIQDNGKIIVGGQTFIYEKPEYGGLTLLRYHSNGSPDSSFGIGGKVVTKNPTSSVIYKLLLSKNRVYAVGLALVSESYFSGVVASFQLEASAGISLSCPASIEVPADVDKCHALVSNIDPVLTGGNAPTNFVLGGSTAGTGNGSASGRVFNNGITRVTYSMADDPSKTCSFNVMVNDLQVPIISNLVASPATLWPPNHKMQTLTLSYNSHDNCDVNACQVTVTSNQPVNNHGDGNSAPDWEILNDHQVRLRAESNGNNTRTYTISVVCKDIAGNPSLPATTTVVVANNKAANNGNGMADRFMVTSSPNPSSSAFNLVISGIKNGEKISVRVFDNTGKVVEQKSRISVNQNIRLGASLAAGFYFAEVVQGKNKVTLKLIKYSE